MMIEAGQPKVVTWREAEDAMMAAFEYLAATADRERAFLKAGSRSCWPQIVRDLQADYPDERDPSPSLSRRMVDLRDRMLTGAAPAANAIDEGHRSLVGRVIAMKLWPGPDVFGWERVWVAEGGRRSGVTSDCFRKRYERAIAAVAVRMDQLAGAMTG